VSKDIFARALHLSAAQRLFGTKKKRTAGTKVCSAGLMNRRKPMSYQDFEGTESPSGDHQARNQKMRAAAGEAFSRASDTARDAGAKAKRAAEGAASSLTDSVMGLLNQQVGASADAAGRFASAMKSAAQGMERGNPMLADLVRGLANNVDAYADALENRTVEQLTKAASDFTRRQPALVFGLAAVAGFLAFRTFKNAQSVSSPSIQPDHDPAAQSHG
jgi:hypothetical protein